MATLSRSAVVLMWIATFVCAALLIWPQVNLGGWILISARQMATTMRVSWAIVVLVSFGCTVWLSIPRWHTPHRLRRFADLTTVPAWVLAIVGVPVGWALLEVTSEIRAATHFSAPERPEQMLTGERIDCLACGASMAGSDPTCTACGWSFKAA